MNFKKRSLFLLFNHETYDELLSREGTNRDRKNAVSLFEKLGFKVKVFNDPTREKVLTEIRNVSEEDHSDRACFACMVLTHGDENDVIAAKDSMYNSSLLFEPFLNMCPSLEGKPKLFFIQACQGSQLDFGVEMKVAIDSVPVIKLLCHADFLIARSTVPGYFSWRNTQKGSWFIQALCKVLSTHYRTTDLLSMMTMVNQRVAYKFQSKCTKDEKIDKMKQTSYVSSTLTRRVFFRRKTK